MITYLVETVFYNWQDEDRYSSAHTNSFGVTSIEYHESQGPGDQHYVDIYYADGRCKRQFNLNAVVAKAATFRGGME